MADKCRKCGRCCFLLVDDGVKLARGLISCPLLDHDTMLCTVFKDRFWRQPACMTIAEAMFGHYLPNDCPYVADMPEYEGPEDDEWNAAFGKSTHADAELA